MRDVAAGLNFAFGFPRRNPYMTLAIAGNALVARRGKTSDIDWRAMASAIMSAKTTQASIASGAACVARLWTAAARCRFSRYCANRMATVARRMSEPLPAIFALQVGESLTVFPSFLAYVMHSLRLPRPPVRSVRGTVRARISMIEKRRWPELGLG